MKLSDDFFHNLYTKNRTINGFGQTILNESPFIILLFVYVRTRTSSVQKSYDERSFNFLFCEFSLRVGSLLNKRSDVK